jgi:hypothetical protein
MTATQTSPTQTTEPDYTPDETALLLTELQMRHLVELRTMAMEVAQDVAATSQPGKPADLAMARISKIVMQIIVLEQQTAGLRDRQRAAVRARKLQAKKQAVVRAVETARAAAGPGRNTADQDRLMRGLVQNFDFSDPRTVSEIVAGLCQALGVPFPAEIWPGGTAAAAEVEAEPAAAAVDPAKPRRTGPKLDRAAVSTAAVMAFAPPPKGSGRDPP